MQLDLFPEELEAAEKQSQLQINEPKFMTINARVVFEVSIKNQHTAGDRTNAVE